MAIFQEFHQLQELILRSSLFYFVNVYMYAHLIFFDSGRIVFMHEGTKTKANINQIKVQSVRKVLMFQFLLRLAPVLASSGTV